MYQLDLKIMFLIINLRNYQIKVLLKDYLIKII